MGKLKRFGVSIDSVLLKKFDSRIKEKNYSARSKAISDLIRQDLIKKEWLQGKEVAGIISIVYDHHKRELVNKLIDIQHNYGKVIISTQHVHLDHANCLEIIVSKGKPEEILKLSEALKAQKGVKFGELSMATTGKDV